MTGRFRRLAVALSSSLLLCLVSAGCSGTVASLGVSGARALNIVVGPSGPFTPGLSPFSTSDAPATMGVTSLVYEPLVMGNMAKPGTYQPWLASSFRWSDGGRTLTFTIPSGRTWSDGKPLTAEDVAYTFGLLKKNSALNVNGIDFAGATAPSASTAVVRFSGPAYTQLFAISKLLIVPQHIWSQIKNPATYPNTAPVGSGPYRLSVDDSQAMVFTRNPRYWQPGLPKVRAVKVVDYTSQNSAISALSAGQIDWGNFFLADPSKLFTGLSSSNRMWLTDVGDTYLCTNTAVKPFDNVNVRKALAFSIDRAKAVSEVEGPFYTPVTSPTGLRPTQKQFLPDAYAGQQLSYDPARVHSLLAAAGLRRPKVSLLLPSEYTDWMSLGQVFVNQMKQAGIDATLQGVSTNAWTSETAAGQYQLTFCPVWQSDGPYTTYNTLLNSAFTAKVGQPALSNNSRWQDGRTDALLTAYQNAQSPAARTAAVRQLAGIVAEQMPIIPLMSATTFGEYSTKHFTGWPAAGNPYQFTAIGNPWTESVVLHLTPTSTP